MSVRSHNGSANQNSNGHDRGGLAQVQIQRYLDEPIQDGNRLVALPAKTRDPKSAERQAEIEARRRIELALRRLHYA
ncbi:hypothetical protein AB5N19_11146 [Seiridium cardinale]|uniref:Uncharacterized protein n=1 Tax=Seiridium cardinale TaxID=138064 RepID=A0ABR2XS07_9PEZI